VATAAGRLPREPQGCDALTLRAALAHYLREATGFRGFGIPMAMAMAAKCTDGRYAPVDWKNTRGLRNLERINEADARALASTSIHRFVAAYVGKVLPAWFEDTARLPPEEVDNRWGTAAGAALV